MGPIVSGIFFLYIGKDFDFFHLFTYFGGEDGKQRMR
jgi:hypothetical protein